MDQELRCGVKGTSNGAAAQQELFFLILAPQQEFPGKAGLLEKSFVA
jgi:hypothetical protein